MAPVFLAGAFCRDRCDIRLYNEQSGGPLKSRSLLGWPDMLVLTGLTSALDRMLHLSAYARTLNPRVIVVAGGHAVRALPRFCRPFFDYTCLGDVEELHAIVRDSLGPTATSEVFEPRFELADWIGRVGYVETSRYCNFRCSFCSLTAEGRKFLGYDIDLIRAQIRAIGRRPYITFIDNNFYGPDRKHFVVKLELIREMYEAGCFAGWSALVTSDFFLDDKNLELVREAGCKALFSGVESFDDRWNLQVNKPQNVRQSPLDKIRMTLEAGIVFLYGLVLDVTRRSVRELQSELEFVLDHPEITLPSYVSLPIPLLGTPFFYECVEKGLLLPETRVRDLDGSTLSLRPMDPMNEVLDFIVQRKSFRAYRARALRHALGFFKRYRRSFDLDQMVLASSNVAALCAPITSTGSGVFRGSRRDRTYVSTTDVLDRLYEPAFRVEPRFAHHFRPTRVTDSDGRLTEDVAPDLAEATARLAAVP